MNGSDFVGVFLGEFETFSKKEEKVLSHKADSSLSRLRLLPMDACVGLDEWIREVIGPTLSGEQFFSQPEMAVEGLIVKLIELSIVLSCRRVV